MQELLERAFDEGKAPAHAALLVRGFCSAWLGSGSGSLSGATDHDASPSLCRPASPCAIVDMNQATDTDLFKVSQQPPNQLCVPNTLVTPTPSPLATAATLQTGACQRPVVGFPQK